jgi:hypothetical protein
MGRLWYYSEADEPVGPLTLAELKSALHALREPKETLIWHDGLAAWRKLETFPELRTEPKAMASMIPVAVRKKSFSKQTSTRVVTVFTFAVGLAIARHLSQPNGQVATADVAGLITGTTRQEFIKQGMATCLEKQEADPDNKSLFLSREALNGYCSCSLNGVADSTTLGELRSYSANDSRIVEKMKSAGAACMERFQRKLMGG